MDALNVASPSRSRRAGTGLRRVSRGRRRRALGGRNERSADELPCGRSRFAWLRRGAAPSRATRPAPRASRSVKRLGLRHLDVSRDAPRRGPVLLGAHLYGCADSSGDRRRSGRSRAVRRGGNASSVARRTPATRADACGRLSGGVRRRRATASARDDGHHAHGSRGRLLGRRESRAARSPAVRGGASSRPSETTRVRAEATVLSRVRYSEAESERRALNAAAAFDDAQARDLVVASAAWRCGTAVAEPGPERRHLG